MKILQLNVWGGKLGNQVIDLLNREKPDIVCLQEAVVLPGNEDLFITTVQELMEACGYEHHYFSPSFSFSLMRRTVDWGNAILSRVPFTEASSFFTRGEHTQNFDMLEDDYNMRNLQHIVVGHHGARLNILNHHGHHIHEHKKGDEETMRQCGMIAEYIEDLEGDVVLCGDFNLAPDSASLAILNALLTNHSIEANLTTTRTPLTKKTEVCDYIFTSKGLKTANFALLPDMASDHAALTIELV